MIIFNSNESVPGAQGAEMWESCAKEQQLKFETQKLIKS